MQQSTVRQSNSNEPNTLKNILDKQSWKKGETRTGKISRKNHPFYSVAFPWSQHPVPGIRPMNDSDTYEVKDNVAILRLMGDGNQLQIVGMSQTDIPEEGEEVIIREAPTVDFYCTYGDFIDSDLHSFTFSGEEDGKFSLGSLYTQGVYFDGEYLYTTDVDKPSVDKWDISGNNILSFYLEYPRDIFVSSSYYYITVSQAVKQFDLSGNLIKTYSFPGKSVWGCCGNSQNIFVSITGKIIKLDLNLNLVKEYSHPIPYQAGSLEIDSSGNLYYAAHGQSNAIIRKIDNALDSVIATTSETFAECCAIAVDKEDRIYGFESGTGTVKVFDTNLTMTDSFVIPTTGYTIAATGSK